MSTTPPAAGRTVAPVLEPGEVALDASAVEAIPWETLHGLEHVQHKLLWRSGDSSAGIMRVEPGEGIASHAHREAHHHAWILEGTCTMLGARLGPGSYVHIPGGVEHAVSDIGPEGCTFLYLYIEAHPA